ncbi:MAG: SLBB domain-containing protein [Planctomycetota bacterium]
MTAGPTGRFARRLCHRTAGFCAGLLLLGSALRAAEAVPPAPPRLSAHLLRPGDVLEITVHEHPEFHLKLRIDTDGGIRFPLCGTVEAEGRTASAIAAVLSQRLQEANIERAQVFVFVSEYAPRFVYVLGEVAGLESKALEIPTEGSLTALQAISSAGGFSERADLRNIFVLRNGPRGEPQRIPVDVQGIMARRETASDVPLAPGDTVIVPSARAVSVLGMVNRPGAFGIDTANRTSLAEMISRGGGFKPGADQDRTLLIRSEGPGPLQSYWVHMSQVMSGAVNQDVEVYPGDIIIVRPRDKIFVLGQVKAAGAFDVEPEIPMTVTRAIAMAGGFDKLAAEDSVLLIREGKVLPVNLRQALRKDGDLSLDRSLQAGDIVFVPESRW